MIYYHLFSYGEIISSYVYYFLQTYSQQLSPCMTPRQQCNGHLRKNNTQTVVCCGSAVCVCLYEYMRVYKCLIKRSDPLRSTYLAYSKNLCCRTIVLRNISSRYYVATLLVSID